MNSEFHGFLSTPRTVWVTGASSGIGRELARQLAQAGHLVLISARHESSLQTLADQYPQQMLPLACDAASPDSMQQAGLKLAERVASLDLAILNAGTCEYLENGEVDLALIQRVMRTNFDGTVQAAALALPLLSRASEGALYVVTSQVTTVALNRAGAYGASKAALEYFFNALRIDRYGRGPRIGVVRPGFVKTPLTDRNDFAMPFLWDARQAASYILQGIDRRSETITFPRRLDCLLRACASLPTSCWTRLAQALRKQPAQGAAP